jgi:hypothetical protein
MAPSSRSLLTADLHRLTLQTLATCWLAQALLAALISQWLPIPVRPLVVDRGACTEARWQELLHRYSGLALQERLGQRRFSPVIQVSVFGEQFSARLPGLDAFSAVPPVGVREEARLSALRERYPSALVLSCSNAPPS